MRSIGISKKNDQLEIVLYDDGLERYFIVANELKHNIIYDWLDNGIAPLEAESASEIDK